VLHKHQNNEGRNSDRTQPRSYNHSRHDQTLPGGDECPPRSRECTADAHRECRRLRRIRADNEKEAISHIRVYQRNPRFSISLLAATRAAGHLRRIR
jgi:hypothetical protein